MTTQDKKDLIEILTQAKSTNTFSPKLTDTIWRGISTLSLMLIVWTLNTVNDLKQGKLANNVEMTYLKQGIDDIKNSVKDFTNEPRFTQSNFTNQIEPIRSQTTSNSIAIDAVTPVLTDIQERLIRLEIKLDKK